MKTPFTKFTQLEDIIIESTNYNKDSIEFGLDYRPSGDKENQFLMKFTILSPKNDFEALKIRHGYMFEVKDSSIVNSVSIELVYFFAFLISRSLKLANESIEEIGQIQIPPHEKLCNMIFSLLKSNVN